MAARVAATCGGRSFTAGTRVLLASGAAVPISQLKPGDKVLAYNGKAGKDQPEAVTAVLVHHDTDLYNLKVKTAHGTEVIHTTASHLFWDPYQHQWIASNKIAKGEHLKTPDGSLAVADGGTTPKVHDGWMWDLTVPGNNDHDFYVIPGDDAHRADSRTYHVVVGDVPVLVHNEMPCEPFGPQLNYEPNPKHANGTLGGRIAPEPTNPQAMLNQSILFNSGSGRRVAYDAVNNEIDVFPRTNGGTYHGYVSTWADLPADARRVLTKAGIFNAKGKYLG